MLQVKTMALGDLAVDRLLDPGDLINQLVALVLHHLNGKAVLRIDYPHEEEAVSLQLVEGDAVDLGVV